MSTPNSLPDASLPGPGAPSDSPYPGVISESPPASAHSDSSYPGNPSDSPYPGAPSDSTYPGVPSDSPPPNPYDPSSNQLTTLASSDPHQGNENIASPSCPVRKSSLSVSLEDLRRSFNAKAAVFPGAHQHSKSAVFGHSSSSFSGPSINHSHSKSFRDANGRSFIVDPKSGKTVWTDSVVETSVSPPPPPPPDSPPDTSISISNPLSFSNTPPNRSGSLAGDLMLHHNAAANNKHSEPREREPNPNQHNTQPCVGLRPGREHNGVVQDYDAVVSASFDQRLQKLRSNHSRQRGSESSVGAFSQQSHRLSTTESAPELSITSVRATSGAFRSRKRDKKKRSQKMENEIIELEGAPMIVRGIHSVRHVQAALNNIRANDRVVGSSNVVIVYSTRKRAYFTCAKDKKGKWRVGKKCTFKEETKAKFRPVTLQLE